MKYVIDKITKKALRCGYCDFEHEISFNPLLEEVISKEVVLDPNIQEQDWYWNAETQEFQPNPLE